ncbi:MAG: TonB-dependent receptor [Candidatus Azobacteroides sp.]|nr:TonB-dependent receptor [Candidatus Azobacteroides sp.]
MENRILLIFFCWTLVLQSSFAQEDTVKVRPLKEVEIRKTLSSPSYLSTAPTQTLSSEKLKKISVLQVSDALKYFPGIQVKDYGGVGGLKTVSIRSLGANYTAVVYDGLTVSDYQSGQIDLGRFSLDNVEQINLYIGENDIIFQPARNQALGGAIYITTQSSKLPANKKREIKASLQAGSWKMLNPTLLFRQTIGPTLSWNISGEYLNTEGNYPFILTYGQSNLRSKEKRNNSDVRNWKWETNGSGQFKNGGKLLFKTYYFHSNRGLPGAVIYYNPYSGERMSEQNIFSQAHYTQSFHDRFDFQANAKFNYSSVDYLADQGFSKQRYLYYQKEFYLSAALLYKQSKSLSFSFANDGIYGDFSSNLPNGVFPSRIHWISALAGKYEKSNFTLTVRMLNQWVFERLRIGQADKNFRRLSPYLGLSIQPLHNLPVRLRAFYKNTYRLPTFADRYYSSVPNPNLKPENANQYNLGFSIVSAFGERIPYISFSADAYYNKVKNKIVARPLNSMVIWSVQNFGKVDVRGIDLDLKMQMALNDRFSVEINGDYTYQNVQDKTPQSEYYGQHLPYTPRHTGSGLISFKMPWADCNYHWIYSGERYDNQSKQPSSWMKSYAEHGISLTKTLAWSRYRWNFSAECLNLSNEQYEVVKNYPMPGRSFRLGVKFIY